MHDALLTRDTFGLILPHCSPTSISSLAQTCRAFSDPCLDYLYSSHEVPLFDLALCLPKVTRLKRRHVTSILNQTPWDDPAWSRFDAYAGKIRKLAIQLSEANEEILCLIASKTTLRDLASSSELFKSLRSLLIDRPERFYDESMSLEPFLVPSLHQLTLRIHSCLFMQQLAGEFADLCSQLNSLSLDHNCSEDLHIGSDKCLEILLHSQNWRSLDLSVDSLAMESGDDSNYPVMEHVFSLKQLESLSLKFRVDWFDLPDDFSIEEYDGLQSLQTLSIEQDLEVFIFTLNRLQKPRLRKVSLIDINFENHDVIEESLRLLADRSVPAAMEDLTILAPPDHYSDLLILPSLIPVLFCFKNLQSLTISNFIFQVQDADILTMAQNWTDLRFLSLDNNTNMYLTLQSLIHLAIHCKHLACVVMYLDTRTIPKLTQSDIGEGHLALKKLDIWDGLGSLQDRRDEVKEFVAKVFPDALLIEPGQD